MKLYHNGQVEGWQIPGKQDKRASRIDVPSTPAELAAWLNFRRVGPTGLAAELERTEVRRTEADAGERPWIKGPPTKEPPRVSPAFLGALDGGEEFIPVSKAAEIDRMLERCPRCHATPRAAVFAWIADAPTEDLERLRELLNENLEDEGTQA